MLRPLHHGQRHGLAASSTSSPTTYRFRLLNGSNARTYRLVLTRDGEPDHGRITQIGSDGGLLRGARVAPGQGLVLASAERADLLVDFSDLAPGTSSPSGTPRRAPFDGTFADPATRRRADLDGLLPYPEVLRIRVVARARRAVRPRAPGSSRPTFGRTAGRALRAPVRAIALVEQEPESRAADADACASCARRRTDEAGPRSSTAIATGRTRTTAGARSPTRFEDTTTFFPCSPARDLAAHQPHRRHPSRSTCTSTRSRFSPGTRRPSTQPAGGITTARHERHRAVGDAPRRRHPARARRQRARPQRHRPRQPERGRRHRRPLRRSTAAATCTTATSSSTRTTT